MPPIFDTKWWGWGRADKSYRLPAPSVFWDFLNQKLGPLATSPRVDSLDSIRLPETRLTDSEIASLQDIVGEKNVSIGEPDRAIHSLGKSYPDLVRIRRGTVPRPTDAVIYPTTEPEVEAILRLAGERAWVVIPFGGGTSVVGGVEPSVDGRVVITADLRQLNRVLEIDTESRLASVQCGIRGPELERQLNAVGFTLGHSQLPASLVG